MKTKTFKTITAIILSLVMVISIMPGFVLAADIANNPVGNTVDEIAADDLMDTNEGTVTLNNGEINHNYGTVATHNGIMSNNYGTVTKNAGEILEIFGSATVTTNESDGKIIYNNGNVGTNIGEINTNHGTVANNIGYIHSNYDTVTANSGTVENNLKGTVNGGTVINNYVYEIDITSLENVDLYGKDDLDDTYYSGNSVYVKEGAEVYVDTYDGYKFTADGAPKIVSGNATITLGDDGRYIISNITGDLKVKAETEFVPLTDFEGIPTVLYAGTSVYLDDNIVLIPENASRSGIYWEILDAGTTGAEIDDPYSAEITLKAEGTLKVIAKVDEDLPQTAISKEFTITVKDAVEPIADTFTALIAALDGDDYDKLHDAADDFRKYLDAFNSLNDEHIKKLGEKLGIESAEKTYNTILGAWFETNVIIEFKEIADIYRENPSDEIAEDLIEQYDYFFNDPNYKDSEFLADIRKFIPDIDELYNKATAKGNSSDKDKNPDKDKNSGGGTEGEKQTTSPLTGDGIGIWFALLLSSGSAVLATALYGKQKKHRDK